MSAFRDVPRAGTVIQHTVQVFDQLVGKAKIELGDIPNEVITYHDPCDLGRKNGVYDAPRKLLSLIGGVDLREMERKKEAGTPTARFDAGGVEGGDFEDQEGGEPTAIVPAEEHVHGPDCDHDHEEEAPKPKRAAKKKEAAAE